MLYYKFTNFIAVLTLILFYANAAMTQQAKTALRKIPRDIQYIERKAAVKGMGNRLVITSSKNVMMFQNRNVI